MVQIICPEALRESVAEWFRQTNRTIVTSYYPDGMYGLTEKRYGFLVDAIDGETFEWEPDIPDPSMIFSRLAKEFPDVELFGYISFIDFRSDIDYSVKISSAPGESTIKEEEIDEAGCQAIWYSFRSSELQIERAEYWEKTYSMYQEREAQIVINGSQFVFSVIESRNWDAVLEKLTAMGGVKRGAVSGKTNYLVVDPRGFSESVVKKALEQRAKGKPVKIVLLDDFMKALGLQQE